LIEPEKTLLLEETLYHERLAETLRLGFFDTGAEERQFSLARMEYWRLALQSPGLGEGPETAVVGFLDVVGEAAAGELLHTQMVSYTLTAHAFLVAAGICAVAILQILLFVAFHTRIFPFDTND